jgi:hypothetical protein
MSVAECNQDFHKYRLFYHDKDQWYEVDYLRLVAENSDLCDEYPSDNFVRRLKSDLSEKEPGEIQQEALMASMTALKNISVPDLGEAPTMENFQMAINHYLNSLEKEKKHLNDCLEILSRSDEDFAKIKVDPKMTRELLSIDVKVATEKKEAITKMIDTYTTAMRLISMKPGIPSATFEEAHKKITDYYTKKSAFMQSEVSPSDVNPKSLDYALQHDLIKPIPEKIYNDLLLDWWVDDLEQSMAGELQELHEKDELKKLRKKIEITEKYLKKQKDVLKRFEV